MDQDIFDVFESAGSSEGEESDSEKKQEQYQDVDDDNSEEDGQAAAKRFKLDTTQSDQGRGSLNTSEENKEADFIGIMKEKVTREQDKDAINLSDDDSDSDLDADFDLDEPNYGDGEDGRKSTLNENRIKILALKEANSSSSISQQLKRKGGKMEEVSLNMTNDEAMNYLDKYMSSMCIRSREIKTSGKCFHEVTYPPDMEYEPLKEREGEPARKFSFELDPFQKEAISCIDNQRSVLVSAHTSSGKTVVADYAIAMALKQKQRVIYTTPIKALSNQKYREFEDMYKDVGLITGDVTINYQAGCLIMTTEVLRNMLYRGSEIMPEVGWVIFDEIHYMRDKERGVVWEESLILLPDNIHLVFLSATIPNARQFAEWVSYIHHQPCHVVYTDVRPVPLQHYIYATRGTGMHLIVDEHGRFREDNFENAMSSLAKPVGLQGGVQPPRRRFSPTADPNFSNIIRTIMDKDYAPVIVFSFSKKECEAFALEVSKEFRLKKPVVNAISEIFESAISTLSDEDKQLPQIGALLSLLQKGIGIHHGGLLPILKEIVEILFGEGLLKVLFATETFAMGLNMPARTVLFTGCKKFDGKRMRFISSGEYIQMSGRAGRRGLDDKGLVIMMVNESVTPEDVKKITLGQADSLTSAFHLTYNMILNLIRVEDINPEYILEKSFHHFQHQSAIPNLYRKIRELQEKCDSFQMSKDEKLIEYHKIRKQLDILANKLHDIVFDAQTIYPYLSHGRMIKAKTEDGDVTDWGVVLHYNKKTLANGTKFLEIDAVFCKVKPEHRFSRPVMEVKTVNNSNLYQISALRTRVPTNVHSTDGLVEVYELIEETKRRHPNGVPLLCPIRDMKIRSRKLNAAVEAITERETRMNSEPYYFTDEFNARYEEYSQQRRMKRELKSLKKQLKMQFNSDFLSELKCRKRVLRRMDYCTEDDVIVKKGRVACELSSGNELLLTELMYNGIFNDLTVPQCVALLSCFFCDDKSNIKAKMSEELSGVLRKMQDFARNIARISNEASLEVKEDEYIASLKPFLMDVCFAWSSGKPFMDLCQMTDIFEGSIIRCLRRMQEALAELILAARSIGNVDLENKFVDASNSINRGIAFAASLYL